MKRELLSESARNLAEVLSSILAVRARASRVELVTYNGKDVLNLEPVKDGDRVIGYEWAFRVFVRPSKKAQTFRAVRGSFAVLSSPFVAIRKFDEAVMALQAGRGRTHAGAADVLVLESEATS